MSSRAAVIAVALVSIAAVATAVFSSPDPVAVVDGHEISSAELLDMRTGYADADVLPGSQLRDDLNLLVFAESLVAAAEDDFGLVITQEAIDDRIANPPERWVGNIQGIAGSPEFGRSRLETEAKLTLVRDGVVGPVILEEFGTLENYVAAAPVEVVQVCGRHVLVATEEEAQQALDRVNAGEDIEALATEISLAPSPFLTPVEACPVGVSVLGNDFAVAVADAELGQAFGPVRTEFGYHVIVIDDRFLPTDEAAFRTDATAFMDPNVVAGVFTDWFNDAVRDADVEIASHIGRWSPDGLGIAEPGA